MQDHPVESVCHSAPEHMHAQQAIQHPCMPDQILPLGVVASMDLVNDAPVSFVAVINVHRTYAAGS